MADPTRAGFRDDSEAKPSRGRGGSPEAIVPVLENIKSRSETGGSHGLPVLVFLECEERLFCQRGSAPGAGDDEEFGFHVRWKMRYGVFFRARLSRRLSLTGTRPAAPFMPPFRPRTQPGFRRRRLQHLERRAARSGHRGPPQRSASSEIAALWKTYLPAFLKASPLNIRITFGHESGIHPHVWLLRRGGRGGSLVN